MQFEPFTFGIPLIARASAANWELVEALLALTLASLAAQTEQQFGIVVAGHDRPSVASDIPFEFLQAEGPAEPVRANNLDSGRKKHAINTHVRDNGGGLLMFIDADDWVDTRLVEVARSAMEPDRIAAHIASGLAIDIRHRRALPIPHPDAFERGFDQLCGSSTIARILPDADDALRRDPYAVLHEHYRWVELCQAAGAPSLPLDLTGAYLVGTSVNHSESHGPFADWRRQFTSRVARDGQPVDDAVLARFGLRSSQLRALDTLLPDPQSSRMPTRS